MRRLPIFIIHPKKLATRGRPYPSDSLIGDFLASRMCEGFLLTTNVWYNRWKGWVSSDHHSSRHRHLPLKQMLRMIVLYMYVLVINLPVREMEHN